MTTEDEIDSKIAEYIADGVLEPIVEEDGEIVYHLGPDAKEKAPEFYQAFLEDIDEALIGLWQKGLIEIEYNNNLEVGFNVTELGKEVANWQE